MGGAGEVEWCGRVFSVCGRISNGLEGIVVVFVVVVAVVGLGWR